MEKTRPAAAQYPGGFFPKQSGTPCFVWGFFSVPDWNLPWAPTISRLRQALGTRIDGQNLEIEGRKQRKEAKEASLQLTVSSSFWYSIVLVRDSSKRTQTRGAPGTGPPAAGAFLCMHPKFCGTRLSAGGFVRTPRTPLAVYYLHTHPHIYVMLIMSYIPGDSHL